MLVTVEDLQNYMDTGKRSPRALIGTEFILAGLQGELEAYLNRPLEVGSFIEDYRLMPEEADRGLSFYDNGGSDASASTVTPYVTLAVRNSPVVSVTAVYASTVGGASVSLTEGTDYGVRRFGIDVWNPQAEGTYTIDYTGGFDGVDYPFFKLLILRAAAREAMNMYDDNKGIKGLEMNDVPLALTGFSEAELKSVKRYRRRRY